MGKHRTKTHNPDFIKKGREPRILPIARPSAYQREEVLLAHHTRRVCLSGGCAVMTTANLAAAADKVSGLRKGSQLLET